MLRLVSNVDTNAANSGTDRPEVLKVDGGDEAGIFLGSGCGRKEEGKGEKTAGSPAEVR